MYVVFKMRRGIKVTVQATEYRWVTLFSIQRKVFSMINFDKVMISNGELRDVPLGIKCMDCYLD